MANYIVSIGHLLVEMMLHWHMNDQWHTTDGDWRRPTTDYQLLQMMLQTFSNRLWPTVTKQHLPLVLVRPSQLPGGEPTTCWLQETDKEYWRILMDTDDQQPFSAISFGGWQTPQSSVSKNTNEYWWRTPISAISFQLTRPWYFLIDWFIRRRITLCTN